MKALKTIDSRSFFWNLFLHVAADYSFLDSSNRIYGRTDICTLIRNFLVGLFISIPFLILAGAAAILTAVLPIVELVVFLATGIKLMPFELDGVGWMVAIPALLNMLGYMIYFFVILVLTFLGLKWCVQRVKHTLREKYGKSGDDKTKVPSLLTLWLKSVKEKTCFYVDIRR